MPTLAQRNFSAGEIAPSLYARTDIVQYLTGLRTCFNFLIRKHGGAWNRPGTRYVCSTRNGATEKAKLVPFIFNSDQTYMLEFGNLYIRFLRNGVPVTVSVVSAYAAGTAYVIGNLVVDGGINYYCIKAGTGQTPASSATYWYPLTGTIYEIPTPYVEADLPTLNYNQSADVITLTHPSYAVRELARSGHTNWTLTEVTFAPSISAPTGLASSASGTAQYYKVTTIKEETFEESLSTSEVGSSTETSTLTWNAVTGAKEYNVYKKGAGVYGFIGVASTTSFTDATIKPDAADTAPSARNPFSGTNNYPSTSGYYQQRQMFANTNTDTEKVWGSKSANFKNMTISSPLQDDDAVTFPLRGRQVNSVKHMIDLGKLIVFTNGAEWLVNGDTAGILRAGEVNAVAQSYNGSSDLRPLIINDTALFVQARQNIVRDLKYQVTADGSDGYQGTDLTIMSVHLFEKFTLTDWAFAQTPNPIAWIVRSDGVLLGLTYLREHKIFAWHRHQFQDAIVENVAVIPEGNEDTLYLVIKRVLPSGSTVRYIERFASRRIDDIKDAVFMDSSLSYDGRNTTDITMALTGSGWIYTDELTLTASSSFFVAGDVGNEIHITDSNGDVLRCRITEYTGVTEVKIKPHKTVPVALRTGSTTNWAKAVDTISGLSHLEGEDLSVLGDGFVVASPNNESYVTKTVASGSVTLDKPYAVIHAGLPFISDVETLDVDNPNGETVADKKKLVSDVTIFVEASRGIWCGGKPPSDDSVDPLEGLYEYKGRNDELMDDPIALKTGQININTMSEWNNHGRTFIRQVDPLPLSVLAIMPSVLAPFK